MQFVFTRGLRDRAVALLACALAAVPFLSGCSTLGIATTEELAATETRLQNAHRETATRVDGLEKNTTDMQAALNQMVADMDTLSTRFARAKTWLETMNLDTISADAQEATKAATALAARNKAFLEHYLEWIKAQHALLEKQIATLEAKMKQGAADTSERPETRDDASSGKPDDSGGGDG